MGTGTDIEHLRKILVGVKHLKRFDSPGEPMSAILAHALVDIQESCEEIVKLVSRMNDGDPGGEDQIYNVLIDVGEELRHVLYHVETANSTATFYPYILPKARRPIARRKIQLFCKTSNDSNRG